ncbi:MAG: hypothetical protein NVS1B13_14060 [Flavisolibacter sp.]
MKNKLLLSLSFLLIVVFSYAQEKSDVSKPVRLGIKGGADIGKIKGVGYENAFKLGYYLGGFIQFNVNPGFGLQGELLFASGTVKTTSNFNDIYITADPNNNGRDIKLNFLQIPLLANISLGSSRVKLQLGPQYSTYLGSKTVYQASKDAFKSGDFAAVGGLWFQLPVINIHARYLIGLSDIDAITNSNSWKTQSIQAGIGITF